MFPGNMLARVTDAVVFAPAVRTTTTNGSAIDVTDYEGVIAIVMTSTAEASTGTMDFTMQDSDDGSTNWNTITPLDGAWTQVTNAGTSQQVRRYDVSACRKFVRGVQTVAGGSPSATTQASLIGIKKVASA